MRFETNLRTGRENGNAIRFGKTGGPQVPRARHREGVKEMAVYVIDLLAFREISIVSQEFSVMYHQSMVQGEESMVRDF